MNHRNRSAAFAVAFVALGLHAHHRGDPPVVLAALLAQFLVYPHLLYLRARRSPNPLRSEVNNTTLDALVFGGWAAGLEFSSWITFTLLVGAVVNPAAFGGLPGLARGLGAFAVGAALGGIPTGYAVHPASSLAVTGFCAGSLLLFLVSVALGAYDRSTRLHAAQRVLRDKERSLAQQLDEIRGLEEQLREQAVRDPLTGLYNRRYLDPTLERELARCRRAERPLSVIVLDVDHFKKVNDTFGHGGGDAVLRALGAHLAQAVRTSDVACRFGGEEFVLVLPELGAAGARQRAEEVRRGWEAHAVDADGRSIASTLSLGVATFPSAGDTGAALVEAADEALYEAKRGGRNRVVVAAASSPTPRVSGPMAAARPSGAALPRPGELVEASPGAPAGP